MSYLVLLTVNSKRVTGRSAAWSFARKKQIRRGGRKRNRRRAGERDPGSRCKEEGGQGQGRNCRRPMRKAGCGAREWGWQTSYKDHGRRNFVQRVHSHRAVAKKDLCTRVSPEKARCRCGGWASRAKRGPGRRPLRVFTRGRKRNVRRYNGSKP